MAATTLADLINPLVIGQFVHKELIKRLVFGRMAVISRDLQGVPGNTLKIPTWGYIGPAVEVAEGGAIPITELSQTSFDVTIKKVAKGVGITDEAAVSGYEKPLDQAVVQIGAAIADKIENDFYASLKTATPSAVEIDSSYTWILDAQVEFGEAIDEASFLYISPKRRAEILKSPDFVHVLNGEKIVNGHIGQLFGSAVIISSRVAEGEAFLLREGALGMAIKRDYNFEYERKQSIRTWELTADQMYVTYINDASKVVYINKVKVTP